MPIDQQTFNQDITVKQGADYAIIFTYKDINGEVVDVTGWSAKMQVKSGYRSVAICTLTDMDTITLGTTSGNVSVLIPGSETAKFPGPPVALLYDIFLTDTQGGKIKLVKGSVFVELAVTI